MVYCGAFGFVFLAFVLGIFKIIDEVVNGDTKVNKLMDNVFIFILRNIMAIKSTMNLTSGFSAGAICYV